MLSRTFAIVVFVSLSSSGCDEKSAEAPKAAPQILRWTDKSGTVHYTDDPASIPQDAKVEETKGAEIKVVAAVKIDAGPTLEGGEHTWRARFKDQRQRIAELEAAIAKDLPHIGDAETNWVLEEANAGDSTFENALLRVRQSRAELKRQQQAMKELQKTADAVNVPASWRE